MISQKARLHAYIDTLKAQLRAAQAEVEILQEANKQRVELIHEVMDLKAEVERLKVALGEEGLVRESAEHKLGELLEQIVRMAANERQGVAIDMEQQQEIGDLKRKTIASAQALADKARESQEDGAAIRDAAAIIPMGWHEIHAAAIARAALRDEGKP